MSAQTVLVTGASGFIAKHVVRELLEHGYTVVGTLRSLDRAGEVRAAVGNPGEQRLRFVAADLVKDDGWDAAMAGVDAVLHTASPFPANTPRDEGGLIRPAVEGTERVLAAADRAGIKRVVLTSSVAAVNGGQPATRQFDASNWTQADHPTVSAYSKSKTLAERAAWAFVGRSGQQLTTVNPALVVGPPLDRHVGTSLEVIGMMLSGRFPMLPRIGVGIVDVRDVARLHRIALETDATIGQRLIASEAVLWFADIAKVLKARYPDRRIPTGVAPDWIIKLASRFNAQLRQVTGEVGLERKLDTSPAQALLGGYIPADQAIVASAEALIRYGLVK